MGACGVRNDDAEKVFGHPISGVLCERKGEGGREELGGREGIDREGDIV